MAPCSRLSLVLVLMFCASAVPVIPRDQAASALPLCAAGRLRRDGSCMVIGSVSNRFPSLAGLLHISCRRTQGMRTSHLLESVAVVGRMKMRLKGGEVDGAGSAEDLSAPGGHSAVFLADAQRRKASCSVTPRTGADAPMRSPTEILGSALRRESRAAASESLSVRELRARLRSLGASEASLRACTERRDLVELLARHEGNAAVVDWRESTVRGDSDGFQVASHCCILDVCAPSSSQSCGGSVKALVGP
jgi:hypothetical protein